MKFLFVHNEYAATSGEETSLDHVMELLQQRGHEVHCYTRSSAEIDRMWLGKPRALCSALYSPFSRKAIRQAIRVISPDIVFVKNLYPFISPSVLPVIRSEGVPVMMGVANYRLVCPNGLHLSRGEVCERCVGGRESWCVIRNCENSLPKSVGYALRNWVARTACWYKNNVSAYISASQFLKKKLIRAGFAARRIHVLPNVVPDPVRSPDVLDAAAGRYVGFVGRISKEKGVFTLLRAAELCPEIEFRLAGRVDRSVRLPQSLPSNVQVSRFLKGAELARFFSGTRIVVSASECYETFGMSVAEALLYARPVVATRIGVFPERVREGREGLLFEPGNSAELARKLRLLWHRPDLCRAMGENGRKRAIREYGPEAYYRQFMNVCQRARLRCGLGHADLLARGLTATTVEQRQLPPAA